MEEGGDAWMDTNGHEARRSGFLHGSAQQPYEVSRAAVIGPILQMMKLRFRKLHDFAEYTLFKSNRTDLNFYIFSSHNIITLEDKKDSISSF